MSGLRRFWFPVQGHLGIGVTAESREAAEQLATETATRLNWPLDVASTIDDVDVRDLDEKHVIPNMGAVVWRGVWFPQLK